MMMQVAIVDDNETNLVFMQMLVTRLGDCIAHCFSSAPEALQHASDGAFDLVVVDYMMPKMDGLEFIRRFRGTASAGGVPIIMVTAYDEREILEEAIREGATDFLSKPVDTLEFSIRVKNLLSLRAAHNRLKVSNENLADELITAAAQIKEREEEVIMRLVRATEYRDEFTHGHVQRIAWYSLLIAEELGMSAAERRTLFLAAPMHDIGKVAIPDDILKKPARLTPEEFEVMKTHTTIGKRILAGSESGLIRMAAEIAISHHERMDGKGYPAGLPASEIPLVGRIVAVADVFDALSSVRPYKAAWPLEQCRAQLETNAGTHLDPECVDAFLARWNRVREIARITDVDIGLGQPDAEENRQ